MVSFLDFLFGRDSGAGILDGNGNLLGPPMGRWGQSDADWLRPREH